MATVITEECINCGACEPECPNTAIYQGGVEYELDGQMKPALSDAIFYIVPEKCTECVGFYDHEACAAVCPVDCCIPDPNRPETEEVLLARAKQLHPDQEFRADFPSRFRAGGEAPATEGKVAEATPAAAPAAAAPPAVSQPATPVAAEPARPPAPARRVEKPTAPPPAKPEPARAREFPGELPEDFETLLEEVRSAPRSRAGRLGRVAIASLQPVLGALPHGTKQALERAVGDRRFFSTAGATGLNILHHMILYPAALVVVAGFMLETEVFGAQMRWWIFLGTVLASVEAMVRLRDGVFGAKPVDGIRFGAAFYGIPLAALVAPFARRAAAEGETRRAAFDGFYGGNFDEKTERDRRYGDVYRFEDLGAAYLLQLEFPRVLPPTGLKDELGLPDTMPDYDFDLSLADGSLVVRGKVVDPRVRKLTAAAPAFPSEFTTQIELQSAVRGFRHRYRDKLLEVVLPKKG